jgi:tetratricopeptide (TPR) repeat protein
MRHVKFVVILAVILLFTAGSIQATEYVAFSLKVAQQRITSTPQGKDFRELHPEVFYLGGITAVRGLVYDRQTGDAIIVGERDPNRAILTLDDFVVALRARFIHGKWPLVSIDPTPETEKTQMQIVRFEGGIEDTQFGEDLFDADYRLKQIGMGLLPTSIQGFKSYWDLRIEEAKESPIRSCQIGSRFWFYPVLPSVSVREEVVSIKGLKVGVFTEVLSAEIDGKKIVDLSTFQDQAGDTFAKGVSENFEGFAKVHSSFLRLQGLDELVALTKAIEEMEEKPDLTFWLKDYRVKEIKTRKEQNVLKRQEEYEPPAKGGVYKGYLQLSGGVELMAIALRFKAGDVTALKDAVLKTRPKPGALNWGFFISEWLIPTSLEMLRLEDVVTLFSHAVFLHEKERYDDAISLYERVLVSTQEPDLVSQAHYGRGAAYYRKGEYDRAIADFKSCLEIDSKYTDALFGLAMSYLIKNKATDSLNVLDRMLTYQPHNARAFLGRGYIYLHLGGYTRALECFENALVSMPSDFETQYGKAVTLFFLGESTGRKDQLQESLYLLQKLIQSNPRRLEPLLLKAYVLSTQFKDPKELLETSEHALRLINAIGEYIGFPGEYLGFLWIFKAQAESELGKYAQAQESSRKALEMMKDKGSTWLGQTLRSFIPKL